MNPKIITVIIPATISIILYMIYAAVYPSQSFVLAYASALIGLFLTAIITAWTYHRFSLKNSAKKDRLEDIEQLIKLKQRFQSFMDNAPFSTLIIDNDRLVYANKMGIINRERIGPLNGDRFYEGLPPDYNAKVLAVNRKVLDEQVTIAETRPLKDADGTTRYWHTVRFPIIESDRSLLGMYAIDVTPIHVALHEKEIAQKQLIQSYKMAALGEMAGSIAHEINNPAAIIMGKGRQLLEILSNEPVDLEEARRFADVMTSTTNRIVRIVNGLRSISRQADFDPMQMTNVSSLIDGTVALVASKFRDSKVELRIGTVEADLMLKCRASEVNQILTNLLNNALDAVENLEDRWVKLSIQATSENVVFVVEDSGPGIPPEVRSRLMTPFFTTKDPGKGTGLGLSLSRRLAENHGGSLQLDENSVKTRFIVIFPAGN